MKRNVEEWIYGELTGEDKEIFGKIEEALGFKLFAWQKSFLLTGRFRRMGATTAECLAICFLREWSRWIFTGIRQTVKEKG